MATLASILVWAFCGGMTLLILTIIFGAVALNKNKGKESTEIKHATEHRAEDPFLSVFLCVFLCVFVLCVFFSVSFLM